MMLFICLQSLWTLYWRVAFIGKINRPSYALTDSCLGDPRDLDHTKSNTMRISNRHGLFPRGSHGFWWWSLALLCFLEKTTKEWICEETAKNKYLLIAMMIMHILTTRVVKNKNLMKALCTSIFVLKFSVNKPHTIQQEYLRHLISP